LIWLRRDWAGAIALFALRTHPGGARGIVPDNICGLIEAENPG
jgi:hypothetical protein